MKNIAVVVPTIRPDTMKAFNEAWSPLFKKHNVEYIIVEDGDNPKVYLQGETIYTKVWSKEELDPDNLVSNYCAGVRQLGFLYIAKYLPEIEYIFTTDDDCFPIGDPIQDHIDVLQRRFPISWYAPYDNYMRGFPYGVRDEAPVMLSHGVWEGNYDWDAPSQLLMGDQKVEFYKTIIPKGIYFPICGMNLAFRREALPYIYFAPVGQFKGAERWDDIFMGIMVVKKFAELNWGIVSGYAKILHKRASNPFTSLAKEAVGILHGEEFYKDPENYKGDPWFDEFREKTKKWFELTQPHYEV